MLPADCNAAEDPGVKPSTSFMRQLVKMFEETSDIFWDEGRRGAPGVCVLNDFSSRISSLRGWSSRRGSVRSRATMRPVAVTPPSSFSLPSFLT